MRTYISDLWAASAQHIFEEHLCGSPCCQALLGHWDYYLDYLEVHGVEGKKKKTITLNRTERLGS